MTHQINSYIESKVGAWAPSTLSSEKARLMAVKGFLDKNPQELWNYCELNKTKSYSRVTLFTRVIDFLSLNNIELCIKYKEFRKNNSRLFKNCYKRKVVSITFDEAINRIKGIRDKQVKLKALQLINSGMRYTESMIIVDGKITGKGNKDRDVFAPAIFKKVCFGKSYSTLLRQLKLVGLTPHMLRKLFATKAVEIGMKEADLLKIMGWESIITAQYYLQPKDNDSINEMLKDNLWETKE